MLLLYKRKKRTARRPFSRKKEPERSGTENGQHPEELRRRLLGLVFVFLLLFGLCEARLAHLALDADAAAAVRRQSSWEQQLTQGRGIIYDHDLEPLTDTIRQAAAVVTAGSSGYNDLFRLALPQDRTLLYSGVGGSRPFVVRLNALPETETAAVTFTYPMRYNVLPLAQHIIGYCSGDGRGVAGMERAFDDWLQGGADVLWAECSTTALAQAAGDVRLVQKQGSGNALQLTLDRVIQRICEDVAAEMLSSGAIVVLECRTGRIKASVSMPQYDPYDVQKSIEAQDTALINRAFSSYNVGSVYKPLLAALALENGLDAAEKYECSGSIEVDGHTYRCARRTGHGSIDLAGALQQSCNCYFIRLGQQLGAQCIVEFSSLCGLGQATQLGGGYRAGKGNLPDVSVLSSSGELAGLSFGQGKLTATPLQLAAAFNVFANDGVYIAPSLAEGLVNSYTGDVVQSLYRPVQLQVLEKETADTMLSMLESVVAEGLGAAAAIPEAAVGGKTGTAQTGRSRTLANGAQQELYDSWFVGFYPAQQPQYTIAVMADSTTVTGEDVAPVFAAVCRQLYYLQPQDLANSTNLGT